MEIIQIALWLIKTACVVEGLLNFFFSTDFVV